MKYCSTRGCVSGASFADSILSGYAADGGLFVPEALPRVDERLGAWRSLDYPSLAEAILALFVADEISGEELHHLTRRCYADFQTTETVPVKRVGGFFVAELFHGPTFCFKDLGQQPLVGLIAHFLRKRGERRTMLVSTTGDTGPAAIRAVSDAAVPELLDIIVFFPEGQISDLQRKQMTTCTSENCRVVAFEGGGDDMDLPLKRLAADQNLAPGLVGINSYNLGRPLSQLVHYFWTYFRVIDCLGLDIGAPIDIAVPCGALGNLAAGFMSRRMGLPVRRLIAGTNSNDITHRTISRGEFHRQAEMKKTMSEAINIQVPYNMERLFYYLADEDSRLVSSWMGEMDKIGRFTLPQPWLGRLQEGVVSRRVDDGLMCSALRLGDERYEYLACPNTAVALAAAWDVCGHGGAISGSGDSESVPVAVLATASPCKFKEHVAKAVGKERWDAYAGSSAFPATARAVLAQAESGLRRFRSRGDLPSSHAAWEAEVREMLAARGAAASAPRSKL